MSGFTTTGITMLSGLDHMPKSILFWHSLTQWLGGLGILGLFLAVAYKGGGSHRLFGAESHKIEVDRPAPGLTNTIKILWSIYAAFTVLVFLGLLLAGMSAFDSLCHTFTALSTGGFSPHDASIEFYRLNGYTHFRLMEYILIAGMILGGMNFLVHYRFLTGRIRALVEGIEMKYLWGIIGAFTAIILAEHYINYGGERAGGPLTPEFWRIFEENVRTVLFQVTSILTTTGFGTRDIGSPFFGQAARQLFLAAMLIGGCVGSTGGGIKILRVVILTGLIRRELFRLRSPRSALSTIFVDGKPVSIDEIQRVSALFFTWVFLLLAGGAVTALLSHHDGLASFSGMFSALGNIGPCFIPVREMALLHPVIKVVYIFGMLAGRLEILPVLILLNPRVWQH